MDIQEVQVEGHGGGALTDLAADGSRGEGALTDLATDVTWIDLLLRPPLEPGLHLRAAREEQADPGREPDEPGVWWKNVWGVCYKSVECFEIPHSLICHQKRDRLPSFPRVVRLVHRIQQHDDTLVGLGPPAPGTL